MDENNFEMEENMTTDRGLIKIKKAEREKKRNEFDLSKGHKKSEEVNTEEILKQEEILKGTSNNPMRLKLYYS